MEGNVTHVYTELLILQGLVISDSVRELVELIVGVIMSSTVAVLGIVGNIVNIMVFYRQGLNTSINISLLMLAINDLGSLLTLLWFNLCSNPLFTSSGIPWSFTEVKHLSAGFPHACFSRITSWITVYILLERCLCMIFPLKIKFIITPKTTVAVIIMIFLVMTLTLVPEYSSMYLAWKFYSAANRTLLGLVFTSHRAQFENVSLFLYGVYMLASFVAVPLLTALLTFVYSKNARFRRNLSCYTEGTIARDRNAIKMVIMLGAVFTTTYSFTVVLIAIGKSVKGFDMVGVYGNMFFVCFSVSFAFDAINSSIHTLLYYKTSSNYRKSFKHIFRMNNSWKTI